MKRQTIIATVAVAVGLAGLVALGRGRQPTVPVVDRNASSVMELAPSETFMVRLTDLKETVPLSGSLRPLHQVSIKSQVAARLNDVLVREGQPVKKGDTIARFDIDELTSRLEEKQSKTLRGGVDALLSSPEISTAGDAFDLESSFGNDFSNMLVTASDPFKGLPSLPSPQRINASLGGAPKESASEAFGRGPGIPGLFAGSLGLPPEWTSAPVIDAGSTQMKRSSSPTKRSASVLAKIASVRT